mmetsp:Transcript_10791/g.25519  ORF Transcript_10791/g.25519 Transcript_10791/m.25519 type:complete len:84 (-) Transcript_10791:851-1102(-)
MARMAQRVRCVCDAVGMTEGGDGDAEETASSMHGYGVSWIVDPQSAQQIAACRVHDKSGEEADYRSQDGEERITACSAGNQTR